MAAHAPTASRATDARPALLGAGAGAEAVRTSTGFSASRGTPLNDTFAADVTSATVMLPSACAHPAQAPPAPASVRVQLQTVQGQLKVQSPPGRMCSAPRWCWRWWRWPAWK